MRRKGLGASIQVLGLKWRPLMLGRDHGHPDYRASDRITKRLLTVLRSWERTPYIAGQSRKGVGVDCIRFWTSVMDEMYGHERIPAPRKPQDTAMHTHSGALSVLKLILSTYHELEQVHDGNVEPMDSIIVGHRDGGVGHVLLVGPQRNTLWHAGQERVCRTGWGLDGDWQAVKHVYRARNRRAWDLSVAEGPKEAWTDPSASHVNGARGAG